MISSKYKVPVDEDVITPEETLVDSMSKHTSVEVPISRGVFRIFYIIIVFVFLFFIGKAVQIQIVEGDELAMLADQGRLSRYPIPSLRGVIYDTDGGLLADNIPTFDLVAKQSELDEDNLNETLFAAADIVGVDATRLSEIVNNNRDNALFVLQKNISKNEAISIQTAQLAGIYVVPYSKRTYPFLEAAGHLVGYTTNITPEELEDSSYYFPTDRIGRLGLESFYEKYLRGEHRFFDLATSIGQTNIHQKAGNNLHTHIDPEMQAHLYKSMDTIFKLNGMKRGAAIAQDPYSGAVLAVVSLPSFDSNIFETASDPESARRIEYVLNSTLRPLFNRVVSGLYSPGSTIKPFFALAGLKEGIVDENTLIHSFGFIEVQSEIDPDVVYTFRDWKVHGWTDVRKAIADSVDVYFYALGGGYEDISGLGIAKINDYLSLARADTQLGIDLPLEAFGIVPSREWKRRIKGEAWYIGDTYNVSIGQGDLSVTPLWINAYIGSIANGGSIMEPQIVRQITDADGNVVANYESHKLRSLPFDDRTLDIVRSGMRRTITDGTARSLNVLPVALAAKTGTAQVANDQLNSLFTVYGPYEDPEIVLTIVVENIGDDQSLSVAVARDFLSWYFDPTRN